MTSAKLVGFAVIQYLFCTHSLKAAIRLQFLQFLQFLQNFLNFWMQFDFLHNTANFNLIYKPFAQQPTI